MDLYGRPAPVVRRNTSPDVSFLNEPKNRVPSKAFAPPSARSERMEADTLLLQIAGERPGNNMDDEAENGASVLLFHHSRPPINTRPIERPQSGSARRPGTSAGVALKQRPSTAREGSRTARQQTILVNSTDRSVAGRYPRELVSEEYHAHLPGGDGMLDKAYIRQLKADIIHCHKVLAHERAKANGSHSARSHTHVKHIHSIREGRVHDSSNDSSALQALQTQLLRYTYSPDAAQLRSAKAKLEEILALYVSQLLRHFLELKETLVDGMEKPEADDDESLPDERIQLQRTDGSSFPLASGCGLDSVSLYASGMLTVLQRVERFRTMILGLTAERTCLEKAVAAKEDEIQRLSEQVDLFKEALVKSMASRPQNEMAIKPPRSRADNRSSVSSPETARVSIESISKELDLAAMANVMEKERIRLQDRIQELEYGKESMEQQMQDLKRQVQKHIDANSLLRSQLEEQAQAFAKELQQKTATMEQTTCEIESALSIITDRCRRVEDTSGKEKQALRDDNHKLEARIRKLEDELRSKTAQSTVKTDLTTQLNRARNRLEEITLHLKKTEDELTVKTSAADALLCEKAKQEACLAQLRAELSTANQRIEHLSEEVQRHSVADVTQLNSRRELELKLSQAQADAERHRVTNQHQANQLELLEEKLRRSVSVDEGRWKQRQQEEETAWHQKLAALEHALAVERQAVQSLKHQHAVSLAVLQEKANHSAAQVKTIAMELETANLCLHERKQQREREQQEFTHQKSQLLDRIASLMKELDNAKEHSHTTASSEAILEAAERRSLEMENHFLQDQLTKAKHALVEAESAANVAQEVLHRQLEGKQIEFETSYRELMEKEIDNYKAAAENALNAELTLRQEVDVLTHERELLLHKLQSTPRGASSSALSEARVELQKAKLKIAALEDKVSKLDSARGKDVDTKTAQLAARERKTLEDQKSAKKLKLELSNETKQLQRDRDAVAAAQSEADAALTRIKDEHKLVRQTITLLAARLKLQMELLGIFPPSLSSRTSTPANSVASFIEQFQHEHADVWRGMQAKWECLQQALDNADWQLVHIRNRLEELSLDAPAAITTTPSRPKAPIVSAFSDAVAAGKEVVPIAEQLNAPKPPVDKHSIRDEEQETFAIALTTEMRAMKESYEGKLEELHHEIRRLQKLRVETAQRLRNDLDDEKQRSHQIITQLTDKCTALEARVVALERALAAAQDRHIELLNQYAKASTESTKMQALRTLHAAVAEECRDAMASREAREKDRLRKLHDYCGSSSVAVERDDKKQLI